jgi:chemotaxis protein CheD
VAAHETRAAARRPAAAAPDEPAREVRVRVADLGAARGDVLLSTLGLGSCVAIVLHDAAAAVGGLAHVLLPSEGLSRDRTNPAKFAGTAVPALLAEMRGLGARGPFTARLVGGASMFGSLLPAGGVNMGERNVMASREALALAGVPLVAEDTGGEHGRSVFFRVADGRVRVRSLRLGEREL